MVKGKVVQVIGPVVDIEFPVDELPAIYNAVTIKGKSGEIDIDLTVEVMQHLGDNILEIPRLYIDLITFRLLLLLEKIQIVTQLK